MNKKPTSFWLCNPPVNVNEPAQTWQTSNPRVKLIPSSPTPAPAMGFIEPSPLPLTAHLSSAGYDDGHPFRHLIQSSTFSDGKTLAQKGYVPCPMSSG